MAGETEVANQSETSDLTDDELNAAMATEVMGWTWDWFPGLEEYRPIVPGHAQICAAWSPATDYGDVFEVVERMQHHDLWVETHSPSEQGAHWCAFVWPLGEHGTDDPVGSASHPDSLPRAICEAALAAVREAGG